MTTPKLKPQHSMWPNNPKDDRNAMLLFFLISLIAIVWWAVENS